MKPYCSILLFILIHVIGFSQNNSRSDSSKNFNLGDRSDLEQYLWGYSKNISAKSEKSLIDFNAMDNWRGLGGDLAVSDDGDFFAYTISKPTGTRYWFRRLDSLVVQSTRNGWRATFAGARPGFFVARGKQYVFLQDESLFIMQLGKSPPENINNVISFKVSPHGRNEWLAYQLKSNDPNCILHNLVTGKKKHFSNVIDYNFDNSGEWLVCKINSNNTNNINTNEHNNKTEASELLLYNVATGLEKRFSSAAGYLYNDKGRVWLLKTIVRTDSSVTTALKYLNAADWKEKIIWSTNNEKISLSSYSLDDSGRQVVFTVKDSTGISICYYNGGMDKAMVKVTNATPGINEGLVITSDVSFTDNGRYIKFFVQSLPDNRKADPEMAHVEVWDHKDLYLQSAQAKQQKIYTALLNIENGKVMPLESNGKKLYLLQGDFAVVKKYLKEEHGDRFWEVNGGVNIDSNWLISLKDGSSQVLPTRAGSGNFWFSPKGRYLVYFDADKGCHYFSFDLHTGILKDITLNIPENQLGFLNHYTGHKPEFGNLAAWLEHDEGVLVYDNYDIWKLDLTGNDPGINITNGAGQANNLIFNLPATDHYSSNIPVINANAPLFLRAFNTRNKQSGFYRKVNLNTGNLKLLYLGNYFMNSIDGIHDGNVIADRGLAPVKARDRETWIVQRQSGTDAPNFYETTNFKDFKRLTNFQPQQRFRWLSEELHTFKHLDGREGQGILYKPADFDSTKKYPVLVVFYGAFSNNLNQFHVPRYIDQAMEPGMSPTWLVNNGYLVFTPDIYTIPLKRGPTAFNVIEGAVQYLKHLPYVDGDKLGCASHSWSAKLGAYLLTHSTSFRASTISEGFVYANPINVAFSTQEGKSRLEEVENGQEYGNLYENKEAWLDQTTVLQADKAKSPLLLFCNKESSPEYQNQTLQLFTALRRLEKKVWWLKYDNGDHILHDLTELKDYTIRYTQFLDHYLKEAPAPLWMTQGLPATVKGIESRYTLDPTGACGKDCTICKKWNVQYKSHPEMFSKPIQEWHWE